MRLFRWDGPIFRVMSFLSDLFILHLLWVICSLPVVTIGASCTALSYAALRRVNEDDDGIIKNFFRGFIGNFKKATGLWLIFLAVGAILAVDFWYGYTMKNSLGTAMMLFCIPVLVFYGMTLLYVFPVQCKFENTVLRTIFTAFYMSVRHLLQTFKIMAVLICMALVSWYSMLVLFLLGICGAGLFAVLTAGIYSDVFEHYVHQSGDNQT